MKALTFDNLTEEEQKAILDARESKKSEAERATDLEKERTHRSHLRDTQRAARDLERINEVVLLFKEHGIADEDIEITANERKTYISEETSKILQEAGDDLFEEKNRTYNEYSLKVCGYRMQIESGKVMNENITGQWRFYLVKSMAQKILDKRAAAIAEVIRTQKDSNIAKQEFEALKKTFTNIKTSVLTKERGDWVSYGSSSRGYRRSDYWKVSIVFNSGSEISFELHIWSDKVDFKLISRKDAQYEAKRETKEWLTYFDEQ